MIDFRYHLVSIVSIFIALAIGIVLGAGPLQQQLGETLTQQVRELRQEKVDLRTQLDGQRQTADAADKFAAAVAPDLVSNRLGGRSVVVVLLSGADPTRADKLAKTLQLSGATIGGRVRLSTAWSDPDPTKVAVRERVAAALGTAGSSATSTGNGSVDERLSAVLARALVAPTLAEANRVTTASRQAWAGLVDAGLVSPDGSAPVPATLALLVAPDPDERSNDDARSKVLKTWTATARALDQYSSGAVLVGGPQSVKAGGVLREVREDRSLSDAISTVDDVEQGMGRIAVVFALREQMAGRSGQYGTGVGATAVLPALPAARP